MGFYKNGEIAYHKNTKSLYNQMLALINQQHEILEKSLLDSDGIKNAMVESTGFIFDAVIEKIMNSLKLEDNQYGVLYGLIHDCLLDDDSFEYMIKKIENFYL